MRRSNRLDATVAAHRSMASESTPLTTVRIETLSPPTTTATLSSKSSVGPSRCTMLSAATSQASTAISRASAAKGTRAAASRITSQASSKSTAVRVTACGHPARSATATEIHNPMAQATGVISGTSRSVTHGR